MDATATDLGPRRSALAEAASIAGLAPSIHNTQPWRWRLVGDALELHAERSRQLATTDPTGRLLILSCGGSLRHVTTALAAEGWDFQVARLPDPAQPDLLAVITLGEHTGASAQAMRDLQMLRVRHTDRRPVSAEPVPTSVTDDVAAAVDAAGARLQVLRHDDVMLLASAASNAQETESAEPEWKAELAFWAGGARPDGLGVPGDTIPSEAPQTTVPARDFGEPGHLPVGLGHDSAAAYAILYGDNDTPVEWLRAGEALVAAWVQALERGMNIVPLSATVEVENTRLLLRRMLANLGEPFLVMRIGAPDADRAGAAHSPRLPAEQVIEIVDAP